MSIGTVDGNRYIERLDLFTVHSRSQFNYEISITLLSSCDCYQCQKQKCWDKTCQSHALMINVIIEMRIF